MMTHAFPGCRFGKASVPERRGGRGPIWGNVHESFILEALTLQSNVWSEMKGVLGK